MDSNPFLIKNPTAVSKDTKQSGSSTNPFLMPKSDQTTVVENNKWGEQDEYSKTYYNPESLVDYIKPHPAVRNLGIGLVEGGTEMVRTINSAIDAATGGRTDFGGAAERTLPEFEEPKGVLNTLARTTGQWAPGMVVGGTAAQSALATTTKVAPLAKAALTSMAADFGGGMLSANPNDQPLVIGDRSLAANMMGWGVDPETGAISDKDLFSRKLNLALDAALVGGGISAAIGLVGKVFSDLAPLPQIKSVIRMGNKSMQEEAVGRDFIRSVGSSADNNTDIQKIIQLLKENPQTVAELSNSTPELVDIAYKNPTVKTFLNQWAEQAAQANPQQAKAIREQIANLNNAINSHTGKKMEAALDVPVDALQQTTKSMVDDVGKGMDNIQTAGPRIERAFQENVLGPKQAELAAKENQLQGAQKLVEDAIKNDPTFGPLVDKTVSIKTNEGATKQLKEISQNFLSVLDGMRQKKNALYANRPKGVKGNLDIVTNTIKEINENAGTDVISKDLVKKIMGTQGDLVKLENLSNFSISDMISSNKKLGNYNVSDALTKLKRSMTTDQLDNIVAKYNTTRESMSNPIFALDAVDELDINTIQGMDVVNWALEAKKFYQEEYLPLLNHPTVNKIMDMQINPIDTAAIDVGPKTRELIAKDVANVSEYPERVLGDEVNPGLSDLYTRYVTNGTNEEVFKKYGLLRVAEKISDEVAAKGKLTGDDIIKYQQEFKKIYPLLPDNEKAKVEQFLTNIRDTAVFDEPQLKEMIGSLRSELAGLEEEVYKNVLQDFFEKNGVLKGNSYASLKQMFSKEGNEESLKKIINTIRKSGDQEAEKAIKGAYGKYLQDSFFTGKNRPSGVNSVSIDNLNEFLDESSSMANYAKGLYGKDFYKEFSKIALDAKSNFNVIGRIQNEISSSTATQTMGSQGLNSILTWFFGVLNPTAARIRTISGYYMKNNPTAPQMREIIDGILADPDYFVDIAKRIQKNNKSKEVRKEVTKYVKSFLIKGAMYGPQENEQFNSVDQQTQQVFQNTPKQKEQQEK